MQQRCSNLPAFVPMSGYYRPMQLQPFDNDLEDRLRDNGLLKIDSRQATRLREFLSLRMAELEESGQGLAWVNARKKYFAEGWADEFFLLSELVESPIEQQLGGHLLCITDGYNEVSLDIFPDAFSDPDFGTYFRCQQQFDRYRMDFLFKVVFRGRWKALNVECDGHPFHEKTPAQAAADRSRDRFLTSQGIQVIRFAGTEIYNRPRKCAAEIEIILAGLAQDLLSEKGMEPRRRSPQIPD